MFKKDGGFEKIGDKREVISFLYETLGSNYTAGVLRFILDDTKGANSVLQLIEKGKLEEANNKIDKIYEAYSVDNKNFSKEDLIETIQTAIELYKEDSESESNLKNVSQSEIEKKDFNETEYENIFNDLYVKLSDPESYKNSIEKDFISYAQAYKALETKEGDKEKLGVNNIIDAYNEILINQNNPDTRASLVWFLPKVEKEIGIYQIKLNEEIIKIRTGEKQDKTFDELMSEIEKYQDIKNRVIDFKNTLETITVEDEKDTVYTTTVYSTSSLPVSIDPKNPVEIKEEDSTEAIIEKTPQEKFEDLIFKKGIITIIIHGEMIESKKTDNAWFLKPKLDFDADSAIMILDELGAKYNKGYNYTWVHPEARLKEDKSGNFYFEYNNEKIYLTDGTVVFDVGKANGLKMLKDGVFVLDHHGDANNDTTSTTQILVETAQDFKKYKDKKEKFPEYLKNYAELTTMVDNLSMDTDMGRENFIKNYANTMPALVPLLYYKNPKILLDFFKKYPNVSLDGFSKKELKYTVGVREYTSLSDNRTGFMGINIYSEIPEKHNPNYIYEEFTIGDIVENQKKVVENSVKEIDYHIQKMMSDGLKTTSPFLGKTVFIDQKVFKYIDKNDNIKEYRTYMGNSFGASTVYNLGYDSMVLLNRDKGNQIFVSSKNKEGLKKFADNLKVYYDNAVIVRESMFILRDKNLKNVNPEYIRNAIIDSAQIDGFDIGDFNKTVDDLINEIRENKE